MFLIFSEDWKEYLMTELRHPRTQKGHLFAFNGDKTSLCEVVCVNDPHSAWFIGNTIGIYLLTLCLVQHTLELMFYKI